MSTYTVNYIVYTAGHRHHHAGSQTQLIPPASGVSSLGEHFPVFAPPTLPYNGNNLSFAFMSVVGNADGNHLYTSPGTKDVQTGSANIVVTVVYAPAGGIGNGGPGVWVDAFNVNTGQFSDSDFMQVLTNGSVDAAKTATANNDGVVSSATAEDMRSYAQVDGVPFLKWEKIANPNTETSTIDYNLQRNEGGLVFAFYQTPDKTPVHPPHAGDQEVWIYVSAGVKVDGGGIVIGADGKPHPVGPWGPAIDILLKTVVQAEGKQRLAATQIGVAQKAVMAQMEVVRKEMR